MELYQIILIITTIIIPLLIIFFAVHYTRKSNRTIKESQSGISDKELIEFIDNEPDKIVDSQMLMNSLHLTKFEARARLRHFHHNGLLCVLRSRNGMKAYYTLSKAIDRTYDLNLTDDPFMTIEDLMLIFKHCEYKVSLQDICLCTGLPIKVINEEMKYFEKEGVVRGLYWTNESGFGHQRIYTLCEPYRSNPDEYLDSSKVNFKLKEIYEKVRRV